MGIRLSNQRHSFFSNRRERERRLYIYIIKEFERFLRQLRPFHLQLPPLGS